MRGLSHGPTSLKIVGDLLATFPQKLHGKHQIFILALIPHGKHEVHNIIVFFSSYPYTLHVKHTTLSQRDVLDHFVIVTGFVTVTAGTFIASRDSHYPS